MPTLFDRVLEELKDLPADAQDALAHEFLELIRSERKWDEQFADPRSETLFDKMAAKVRADIADGKARVGDPSDPSMP